MRANQWYTWKRCDKRQFVDSWIRSERLPSTRAATYFIEGQKQHRHQGLVFGRSDGILNRHRGHPQGFPKRVASQAEMGSPGGGPAGDGQGHGGSSDGQQGAMTRDVVQWRQTFQKSPLAIGMDWHQHELSEEDTEGEYLGGFG